MSHIPVRSMDPGAGSLPAELRIHGYGYHADGESRLHWGQRHPQMAAWAHEDSDGQDVVMPNVYHELNPRAALAGIGDMGYYDANGVWQPDESPYPVVMNPDPGVITTPPYIDPTTGQPTNYIPLINAASGAINSAIALTAGGSLIQGPGGTAMYANPQAGAISATGGGGVVSTPFGSAAGGISPMMIMGFGAIALLVMMSGRR